MSIFLDGLYPSNPLWLEPTIVFVFEMFIIAMEFLIAYFLYDWAIQKYGAERRAYIIALMVTAGNIVTFGCGAFIQFLINIHGG